MPKRLGGDPARPVAAADQMRAGEERQLAALRSSPRRSRGSTVKPRHCNEPREGRGPASRLRLSCHATRGPRKAPPRHANAAPSRGSRGEHRGEGRGSVDEPQKGQRQQRRSSPQQRQEFSFLFFCVFRKFCDGSTFLFALKNWRCFGMKFPL